MKREAETRMLVEEERVLATLRERFGHEAFRAGQEQVVRAVLEGRDALVVLPTGAGKSLMYQLPAVLLEGITLVVSPLIALMKDQTDKMERVGVSALTINSGLTGGQKRAAEEAVAAGAGEILYVTPERFRDRAFFEAILDRKVALFVVDEAHCISEWGHDFRPDYMMLGSIAERLGRPPILALTATATPDVQRDVVEQLRMDDPFRIMFDLIRPNLYLELQRTVNDERKLEALVQILEETEGSGIVYFATVKEAERLYAELEDRFDLALYHGQRTSKQRREAQDAFMNGDVKAVFATNAFGLGIDKADIRFVAHWHVPGSPEAYYQEVGRSGRDGAPARCVILYREEDRRIQSYFLGGKYPSIEEAAQVARVVNALKPGEAWPLEDIAAAADVPARKARIVLTLLKREDAVREYRGGGWERMVEDVSQTDLEADLLDYEARRKADREKLDAMIGYCRNARCRTAYLMEYFGQSPEPDHRCGHCDVCAERA
ncbi:MAG: ATP-dependent DNA helicase [Gemmatimonadetes bacterium]|nr:ATP-dependent DNA helicase [Gemmatimonadota bacterium]